ncbi:MAG TPA: hypothetical protein PKD03_07975 [Ignavibacteriaceae bacterium]|nr:hypothetical protein [Ignavibacteriaceae bacterium]
MAGQNKGINIDEGLPLIRHDELANLYIPTHSEEFKELIDWINLRSSPILIGGQIGSGKSTFINKAFNELNISPDLLFHFDQNSINIIDNNPLLIFLKEILNKSISLGVDLSFTNAASDLTNNEISNLIDLYKFLSENNFSLDGFSKKKRIAQKISENQDFTLQVLEELLRRIEEKLEHKLLIVASGIDKYKMSDVNTFFLNTIALLLSKFKTMFEVNAVHIFDNKWVLKNYEKIFIGTVNEDHILNLFRTRMGVYAFSIKEYELDLARLSGGNFRQAIRLLFNFLNIKKFSLSSEKTIFETVRKTNQDFFAFSTRPSDDLMRLIQNEKKISSTTITLPGDYETAQRAIYENWILIDSREEADRWNAQVNPLVEHLFLIKNSVQAYEKHLLNLYAKEHQISNVGLSFNSKTDEIIDFQQLLRNALTEDYSFNTTDILKMISSTLFSKSRTERIIIAYQDTEIVDSIRNYLFANANSYEYQSVLHIEILNNGSSALNQILEQINSNKVDIFSFDFPFTLNDNEIEDLDKARDIFISYQMIWWISIAELKKMLPKWVQLRQLFQIFFIEDELLSSINLDEVQKDIDYYTRLKDRFNKQNLAYLEHLEKLFNWLRQRGEPNE